MMNGFCMLPPTMLNCQSGPLLLLPPLLPLMTTKVMRTTCMMDSCEKSFDYRKFEWQEKPMLLKNRLILSICSDGLACITNNLDSFQQKRTNSFYSGKRMVPRLREFFRQGQAEVVSNSQNKILATWERLLCRAL